MVIDKVRNAVDRVRSNGSTDFGIVMPADSGIIKKTSKATNIDTTEAAETIKKFQEVGRVMYPVIEQKTVDGQDVSKMKNVKGDENPSFLYSIDERDNVLVVGGAGNIIASLAGKLDMSSVETNMIRTAHRLAAEANGYSEHILMDDVLIVPKVEQFPEVLENKEKHRGEDLEKKKQAEELREIDEEGYTIETPEKIETALNIDNRIYAEVSWECRAGEIALRFDPNATRGGSRPSIVKPNGDIVVSREMAEVFGIRNREIAWDIEGGSIVGTFIGEMEEKDRQITDTIRTSITRDEVERKVYVHLSSDHLRSLGLEDGDVVSLYLDGLKDSVMIVLTPDADRAPTDFKVTIRNRGTGTEMLCFVVPPELEKVLDLAERTDAKMEWGLGQNEIVGKVIED